MMSHLAMRWSHRVSISMDTSLCLEALEEAFAKYGQPEIFNPDQSSQFTGDDFTILAEATSHCRRPKPYRLLAKVRFPECEVTHQKLS